MEISVFKYVFSFPLDLSLQLFPLYLLDHFVATAAGKIHQVSETPHWLN